LAVTTTTLAPPPPGITFTFTNDPSVPVVAVGDTVDYSYCGENTSDVDLEVVRVVDDRFGVLEVPEEQTIVSPGETVCNTDLGLPVSYEVAPEDAGTTIVNNAVVTVRTVGAEPQAFQAADPAEVRVLAAGEQVEPTTTTLPVTALADTGSNMPAQLIAAGLVLASGSVVLVIGRRRSTN
jgi:LPXTG-motif cell wall-anchored protein